MSLAQGVLILTLLVAFGFMLSGRVRVDVAALGVAVLLGLAQFAGLGMLDAAGKNASAVKAISGFGQPVVITLLSLFIITRVLEKSGITAWITAVILRMGGSSEPKLIGLFAAATAVLSLFMNNLAAGALVLPSALDACRRTGIRPSKLLIPVAYGSLLGGAATYFTTANIIVSDLLVIATPPQSPLHILDFTPTGGLIAAAGILFMVLFGHRLLPDRPSTVGEMLRRPGGVELEDAYHLGERLWEGCVQANSKLVGLSMQQAAIGEKLGVAVPAILRGGRLVFPLEPEQTLLAEDKLLIVGREQCVSMLKEEGVQVDKVEDRYLSKLGLTLVEVMTSPRSEAQGKTLKELDFRQRYGFTALALLRKERSYRTGVADLALEAGDSVLLAGPTNRLARLQTEADFIVLEPGNAADVQPGRVWLPVTITLLAVAASIAGVPVYLAMLAGALICVLLRLISMEEAYRAVEWQAIFLVAGMYSVSVAMVQTGLAGLLGDAVVRLVLPFGPLGLAAGAFLLTGLLTQVMGGQVTALVTGPVTISAAIILHTSPQAIAVATAVGCSVSFLTPIAHPVNILMIAPANYRFGDFFRIGWRLTIICFLMLMLGMALFWKL